MRPSSGFTGALLGQLWPLCPWPLLLDPHSVRVRWSWRGFSGGFLPHDGREAAGRPGLTGVRHHHRAVKGLVLWSPVSSSVTCPGLSLSLLRWGRGWVGVRGLLAAGTEMSWAPGLVRRAALGPASADGLSATRGPPAPFVLHSRPVCLPDPQPVLQSQAGKPFRTTHCTWKSKSSFPTWGGTALNCSDPVAQGHCLVHELQTETWHPPGFPLHQRHQVKMVGEMYIF